MPLFSIITTVYNNERYIKSAVESVLQQSFKDIEYIIVDDGSTDRTPQIIDRIAEKDCRVRVIHQSNQWIFASLNNGIREAKGDYIFVINSDDRMRSEVLNIVADKIRIYDEPDIIWCKIQAHHCDSQQQIISSCNYGHTEQFSEKDYYFSEKESVRDNWNIFLESGLAHNQINFYKRRIILKHLFRNDVYGADVLFNISIAPKIKTALIMKEIVYDFFIYGTEEMNTSVGKYYGYEHDMYNEFFEQYKKLYIEWGRYKGNIKSKLCERRLKYLTSEIRALNSKNCTLSFDEKIDCIFSAIQDEMIITCADEIGGWEELESRVLSGVRELLVNEVFPENSKMYFVYELLESLLRYEKNDEDYSKIEHAINHPLNPLHIGKSFYKRLLHNIV